ncbi:MAG: dephospho-CoA kinase [Prevotellaceae bacterium]|jgi:dephospho-CoA kinase|nr:dephospho-CoA kinase [Prevotellaceae bacterium]
MTTVGLSGGMGSGKTVVSRIFHTLGIPVFYADAVTKELYDTHEGLRQTLTNLLGEDVYQNGCLQRKRMAALIFSDGRLLQKVNALIHPLVLQQFHQWAQQQQTPYVVQEAAILFESGTNEKMDYTIAVTAPEALRITRTMQRDNITKQEIKNRLQWQWPDEKRNAKADFIIINDDQQALLPQVLTIHENILKHI